MVVAQRHLVPPHDLAAEQKVLAEMLLGATGRMGVRELVRAEDFYRPAHARIFEAISLLDDEGEAVDAVSVLDALRRLGAAEGVTLADIIALAADGLASENFARTHARIVAELAAKRRLLGVAVEGQAAALDPSRSAAEVAEQVEEALVATERADLGAGALFGAEGARLIIDRAEAAAAASTGLVGLPTGHVDLDALLHGLPAESFVVVGADTSVGKTTFGVGVHLWNALRGTPALYATAEMAPEEVARRQMAVLTRVPDDLLRTGRLTESQWGQLRRMEDVLGHVAHGIEPVADVAELRLRARGFKRRHGLGLVTVDNLHDLAQPSAAENMQVEVAGVAASLKRLARDLGCAVVALAQLNSGPTERKSHEPALWDIRDSRRVAQLADVVLLLHRPDRYDPASPDAGTAEVHVAKNRNGPTGAVRLAWLGSVPCFADLASEPAF